MSDDLDFETDPPDGEAIKAIAHRRWQGIEGFNFMPGLAPLERRVGIAMICCMDAKTMQCYPSERYLADVLGVNLVSVKKAKAGLKRADLINWYNPSGPRHLSRYGFNWTKLCEASAKAKAGAVEARNERRNGSHTATYPKPSRSQQTTIEPPRNGSHTATNQPKQKQSKEQAIASANGSHSDAIGSHLDRQGSHTATAKVATRLPDTSHRYLPKDGAQPDHDTAGAVGAPPRRPEDELVKVGEARQQRGPIVHFPGLIDEFGDDDEALERIIRAGHDGQAAASKLLKTRDRVVAREYLMGKRDEKGALLQ